MNFKDINKEIEKRKQKNRIFIGGIFILVSVFIFVFTFNPSNSKKSNKKEIIEYSFREEVYCKKGELYFFNNYGKFNKSQWAWSWKYIYINSKYMKNVVQVNIKWHPSGTKEIFYLEKNKRKKIQTHNSIDTGFYLTSNDDCILIATQYYR